MVLDTLLKLCMTEPDFLKNFFCTKKLGKWTQNGPKAGFLIFHVPAQILYLGQFLFMSYGPKCSQPIRL